MPNRDDLEYSKFQDDESKPALLIDLVSEDIIPISAPLNINKNVREHDKFYETPSGLTTVLMELTL